MFNGSRIFISGATGSWGQTLTTMLLDRYDVKQIICFSRGELQQVMMKRKFKSNPKLKFVIGDIRDYDAVRHATKDVDYIFHLAALKHVPVCEENVQETIKTNINGTTNIVNAAIENRVKKVIDVSSDKAVEPINLYGMTKSVGEKIIVQANDLSDFTKFVCIRGGNVMGSSGSVIPFFIDQINAGGPITITDNQMTRFFITLEEAIELVFKASIDSIGGETFVINMPACYITDIAELLMEEYGTVEVKEVGIRPGEKLDEMLISNHESKLSYCYDTNYFLTLPASHSQALAVRYQDCEPFPHNEFSSKTTIMNKTEIKEMLKKGKFI
jgi:FlaA1/EpsC-like NDP-sugar epimerase|tara:strand:+ start:2060 stop:3043 length:984 start_codon:yes stop_codon:yes gene_type:complete